MSTRIHPPSKKKVKISEKLKAVVRVRPLIAKEGKNKCLGVEGGTKIQFKGLNDCFNFDRIYTEDEGQEIIYKETISPIVESWVSGYNACVFAYGQTGSGKTFTMLGSEGGHKTLDGIIPRVAEDVFKKIAAEESEFTCCMEAIGEVSSMSQYQIRISYIEVYNDDIRDLLGKEHPPEILSIRETNNGRVFVENCKEIEVNSTTDVMKVIKKGSARRATGRTNMNEHSSRSHAVLTMIIEHRWKLASQDCCQLNSKISYLNLVDLAGSERSTRTGNKDTAFRESISINSGLFSLANVITSLAEGAKHVPYRDSSLTRLLQSSLSGDSLTTMLACVSPAEENSDESLSTIRYAQIAKKVVVDPTMKVNICEDISITRDPLHNDIEDLETSMNRRTMWIDTEFHGSIFSRAVGNETDPLILFIHGSGPTNSSLWWNGIVHEISVVTSVNETSFFMVAIDCPGYGNSTGDRQEIRSNPGSLVKDIIKSLGRLKAFAICGSSQGACATFNSVLEVPDITDFIIVMDPVGHDVFRYKTIKQPSLLLFDIDDAGHPVKVGRWMRDNLNKPHYFEFSSKTEPYWHSDNMVTEILNMFSTHANDALKRMKEFTKKGELGNIMTRLAGGLVSWCEFKGIASPMKHIEEGLLQPPSSFLSDMLGEDIMNQLSSDDKETLKSTSLRESLKSDWKTSADPHTGKVYYQNKATGETTWSVPESFLRDGDVTQKTNQNKILFNSETDSEKSEIESAEEITKRLQLEHSQSNCDYCDEVLWKPQRAEICRHVWCCVCHMKSHLVTKCCPVVGCDFSHVVQKVESNFDHQNFILGSLSDSEIDSQKLKLKTYQKQRDLQTRIIVEYGNTAIGSSGEAYTVNAFLRVVKIEKGKKAAPQISRVEFDINPRFPKSAIKVMSPPYTLQRTMALAFSCNIAIRWKDGGAAHTVFPYRIHHEPSTTRRAVLIVSGQSKGSKKSLRLPTSGIPEIEI